MGPSKTQYEVSIYPSKAFASFVYETETEPPYVTVFLDPVTKLHGSDIATVIAMLCRYNLTELICMASTCENPEVPCRCDISPCMPERIAEMMFDNVIDIVEVP